MDLFQQFADFFLHLDKHLDEILVGYQTWTYAILFIIVFCETGLVVTPFLPGDSLLFAAGVVASKTGNLHLGLLMLVFFTAALAGDNVNYFIGKALGPKLFKNESSRFFKRKHLDRTHEFFEKHGRKAIVIARFVPIVRTFAPFVAGMGTMTYRRFITFSVLGAILWVGIFVPLGYFFGNSKVVENNFGIAVLAVIGLSLLPAAYEVLQHRRASKVAPTKADL